MDDQARAQAEQLVETLITERLEAMRQSGKEITEEQVAEVRKLVSEALFDKNSQAARFLEAVKSGEGAREFSRMNHTLGLPGAVALFRSLVRNCPGMSPRRAKTLLAQMKYGEGLEKEIVGSLTVTIPLGSSEKKVFHLRSAEVPASYNVADELEKVAGLLAEKDLETLKEQMSAVVLFIRKSFGDLLVENVSIVEEVQKCLPGRDLNVIHVSTSTSRLYLKLPDKTGKEVECEPCAGLLLVSGE